MTLIIILIALVLDYFIGSLERFRKFDWFISIYYWLEKRFAHYQSWDSALGLITLLSIPAIVVYSASTLLGNLNWLLELIFALVVLIYCLVSERLDSKLGDYITAIEDDNVEACVRLSRELSNEHVIDDSDTTELAIIKSSLVDSHKRAFAVIFWFLLLGAVGPVLYRLINSLHDELKEIHSGFSDSTHILLNIFEWPSSRLMVISMALAGSLVDALPGWKKSEHLSFETNNQVLIKSGIGALQYLPDLKVEDRGKSYWIGELKSLINRTLIIWLAVLGIMTLSGTLG